MLNNKKQYNLILYVLLIISILTVVMPIIIGAGYTYPCEDDFSFELGGKTMAAAYGNLSGALHGAYGYYTSWQGTYLANFLWHLIRPYDRGGLSFFSCCHDFFEFASCFFHRLCFQGSY